MRLGWLIAAFAVGCYGWEPTNSFTAYIRDCEGFRAYPYKDFGNGAWTVGYGHRCIGSEYSLYKDDGISKFAADMLLKQDLRRAYKQVEKKLGYSPDGKEAEMLVDFQFNGCLSQFPKLTESIVNGNTQGIIKEHKRHANGRPLTRRNNLFKERFICE